MPSLIRHSSVTICSSVGIAHQGRQLLNPRPLDYPCHRPLGTQGLQWLRRKKEDSLTQTEDVLLASERSALV